MTICDYIWSYLVILDHKVLGFLVKNCDQNFEEKIQYSFPKRILVVVKSNIIGDSGNSLFRDIYQRSLNFKGNKPYIVKL